MIKGKKVVMNDKYHVSEKNKGKIFEVASEPYNVCGTVVVKLKGLAGAMLWTDCWRWENDREGSN